MLGNSDMHLQAELSMGYHGSISGEGNLTKSVAKTPGQVSHKRVPTESELFQGHKRPLALPERCGVESRKVVIEEAKRAIKYFDLTEDFDGRPPLKIRRVGPRENDTTYASRNNSTTPQTAPHPKIGSPRADTLVGYIISSSRSAKENQFDNEKPNGSPFRTSDDFYNFGEEDSEARQTSEAHQRPKIMPFVDEAYGSFTASQECSNRALELSEADLAEQLINSDNLRSTRERLDFASNETSILKASDIATQNAIDQKERTEREGVAKSKALREVAKNQNGHTLEQPHEPVYTSQEVNILSMIGRAEGNKGRRASNSSVDTHTSSSGTSNVSGNEDGNGDGNEDGVQYGWDDDDLFHGPGGLSPATEYPPDNTQEPAQFDIVETRPTSPNIASTYPRHNVDRNHRTCRERFEKQLSPSKHGHRTWTEIEDLEAGAQKLEAYTKLNERQKAGPRTFFTPRHELDKLDRYYPRTKTTGPSPPTRQKFFSPFSEPARQLSNLSRRFEEASDEPQGLVSAAPKQDALIRAPNRYGGLAMLAQNARVENGTSMSSLPHTSTPGSQNGEVERRYRSTTVNAFEFKADLSIFKRQITQKEREVVNRHEWLKERQRALKTLQAAYVEAATVACITGVTEVMDKELPEVDEFKKIVLGQGNIDRPKRTRILDVKANMIRRQTYNVPDDKVQLQLGMLIDRKDRQKIDDELNLVEKDLEIVGNERRRELRRPQKKKKQVTFVSPGAQDGTSTIRTMPDGTVVSVAVPSKVARPKFGTEEYRQSQSETYWASQQKKEDALRERLKTFDQPEDQTTTNDGTEVTTRAGEKTTTEEDAQSAVSEEEAGWEMFANMGVSSTQPVSKAVPGAKEVSLQEMQRLDEERKQQEVVILPGSGLKATDSAPTCGQAPDAALAAKMRMNYLGILGQNEDVEVLSDAASERCGDTRGPDVQMVNNYVVYGRYTGVAELEDCAKYRLGRFLKKDNAETLIGEKVVEFCDARKRDIAAATAAGDEQWLAKLGDPEAGTLKHDMKSKEQMVDYPASSCRIWMELHRVEARSKKEKEAVVPTNTFVALHQRSLPDGSTDTPSWDELVTCTGPNGVWLANKEACRIMGEWYAEHMEEGYAAMQRDALEEKVTDLGDEGLFDEEDEFLVGDGLETMRVWVEGKRDRR